MIVCTQCGSPSIQQLALVWVPVNDSASASQHLTYIGINDGVVKCLTCHQISDTGDNAETLTTPPIPRDTAQAWARELTAWYTGLDDTPYRAQDIVSVWPMVCARWYSESTQPYVVNHLYNQATGSWTLYPDVAGLEWLRDLIQEYRMTRYTSMAAK